MINWQTVEELPKKGLPVLVGKWSEELGVWLGVANSILLLHEDGHDYWGHDIEDIFGDAPWKEITHWAYLNQPSEESPFLWRLITKEDEDSCRNFIVGFLDMGDRKGIALISCYIPVKDGVGGMWSCEPWTGDPPTHCIDVNDIEPPRKENTKNGDI